MKKYANNQLTLSERMRIPTPPFFKKLQNAGPGIAEIAGTFLAAPVTLPEIILKIATYALVPGKTIIAVSQATCSLLLQDERYKLQQQLERDQKPLNSFMFTAYH